MSDRVKELRAEQLRRIDRCDVLFDDGLPEYGHEAEANLAEALDLLEKAEQDSECAERALEEKIQHEAERRARWYHEGNCKFEQALEQERTEKERLREKVRAALAWWRSIDDGIEPPIPELSALGAELEASDE